MNRFCGKCGSPLVDGRCPKCDPVRVEPRKEKKAGKANRKAGEESNREKPAGKKGKVFWWALFAAVVVFILLCLHLFGVISLPFLNADTLVSLKANKPIEPETGLEEPESESESQESGTEPEYDAEREDAEDYYNRNGLILDKETASQSTRLFSETGLVAELQSRGFAEIGEMYAEYTADGEVSGFEPITVPSDEKHPTYSVMIRTDNGDIWTLQIVEDQITAYPVSYMWENEPTREILLAEDAFTKTYDSASDTFFTVQPNDDAVLLIPVTRITAETLAGFTQWEIAEYDQ